MTDALLAPAAGALESVADVLAPVVEPLAQVVAPVVEPVAQVVGPVAQVLAPVVRPVAEVLGSVVGPVAQVLAPVVQPVARVLAPVVEALAPVVRALAPVVQPVTGALSPVVDVVGPVVGPLLPPVVDVLGPVLPPLGPGPSADGDGTDAGSSADGTAGPPPLPTGGGLGGLPQLSNPGTVAAPADAVPVGVVTVLAPPALTAFTSSGSGSGAIVSSLPGVVGVPDAGHTRFPVGGPLVLSPSVAAGSGSVQSSSGGGAGPTALVAVLITGVLGLHLARGGLLREREARLASLALSPVHLPG